MNEPSERYQPQRPGHTAPNAADAKLTDFCDLKARGSTWERDAARQLGPKASVEHIIGVLGDSDPNQRIIAAMALGYVADVLDECVKRHAVAGLMALLADRSLNEYEYGGPQDDEDAPVAVSEVAAESLVHLGYASNAEAVAERARAEGVRVFGRLCEPAH